SRGQAVQLHRPDGERRPPVRLSARRREGTRAAIGRADKGNRLPLVASKHAKVRAVNRDNAVTWKELAHADQADVREVGVTIRVSLRQGRQLRKMIFTGERDGDE